MHITVIAAAHNWELLAPLLDAYDDKGYAVQRLTLNSALPPPSELVAVANDSDALLVIGPRQRSPRTVLPGPVVRLADGRAIPAGWLPDIGPDAVRLFGRTAAQLQRRAGSVQSIAVLSQWHPQYLKLAQRIERILRLQQTPVLRWSSDLLLREDMARGLRCGLAAAIYVGHGWPVGWVGYRGTRLQHLADQPGEPLGALLSLSCYTASRRRTGLSFAEGIPLYGIAGAAFGAVTSTLHFNNTRWAVRVCLALKTGVSTVGELIVAALPSTERSVTDYRLLGDPLAPLVGTADGLAQAQAIELYP